VTKDTDLILPNLDPEAYIKAFRADDEGRLGGGVEEDVVGIQIAELDYLVGSKAATASLSENYVGLPY